jgi:assimilatory nitrate reductase catalytic subunit
VIAIPDGKGGGSVAGDSSHPANFGRLCSKGLALSDTLGLETRVLHPMVRQRDGKLARVNWEEALDAVASGFERVLDRDGPEAIAFYLSGQLLTEDYYVANKLMKGFLGSANVDTNSRLCMASSVTGHKRSFGADVVPGCYEDLDEADLIVLVGSNAAWCHPILFQRMVRNKRERGAKIVVIDPRRTATAEEADLFLAMAPGMDAALFSGLFAHLASSDQADASFIDAHTDGLGPALAIAREIAPDLETISRVTRLSQKDIALFFDWFTATGRTVTCYSQGVNQSAQGTDKVNAIVNCHLVTGRIGKPGMGPFSLTGQPNAMGGREVGGLANQLAAHMSFSAEDRARARRFWNAPRVAEREGLKAVDMFEAIEQGRIKALWVMGTNPAVSLPRAASMVRAIGRLEHFVVSDNVRSNDTINAGVHILLPAAAWGEKDGTVTNSERRISRQRRFLPLPGEARPDWWMVSEVARRMGFGAAFAYDSAAAIFSEHAALSAFENHGGRAFNLSGAQDLGTSTYDALEPFQWPVLRSRPPHSVSLPKGREHARTTFETPSPLRERAGSLSPSRLGKRVGVRGDCQDIPLNAGVKRLFAEGGFFTADRKARFIAIKPPALAQRVEGLFPLVLNTGRLRDQWHTMTRTGLSPRLSEHSPEPVVEVHPADAARFGLDDGGFAKLSSAHGECILRLSLSEQQMEGSVFAYIHWNGETAPSARISNLVAPFTDPFSGQPEAKATPCAVEPLAFASEGFSISRTKVSLPQDAYWARVPVKGGFLTAFAMREKPVISMKFFANGFPLNAAISEYHDEEGGLHGGAAFTGGALAGCFFVASNRQDLPDSAFLKAAFIETELGPEKRGALLSGKAVGAGSAGGATVCSCFGVRTSVILAAIEEGCADVFALGQKIKAGTNCGSCQSELKRIITSMTKPPRQAAKALPVAAE